MTEEASDIGAEIAEIEQTISTDNRAYQANKDMQGRYLDLLQAREAGTSPPAVSPVDMELAEVEQRMRTDFRGYQGDPEQRARYLELLEAKETGAAVSTDAPALAISDLGDPIEAVGEYQDAGNYLTADVLARGDPTDRVHAVNFAATEVMRDIGNEERATIFLESFNRLPDKAQAQTFEALLSHADDAPEATPAQLQTFIEEDDAGEALVAEWGEDAAFHLGVAQARLAKIFSGLSADEKRQAEHFVTSAPPAEWAGILRQLANPAAVQTRAGFKKMKGAAR